MEGGWVQVSFVADFEARDAFAIPAGAVPIAELSFRVRDDAREGTYSLTFTREETADYDGNFEDSGGRHHYNSARHDGAPFDEENEHDEGEQPSLVDGAIFVSIIGDVGIFVRGDANLDRFLDISDPVTVLFHLFLGGDSLSCDDAADANDDGKIDVSDPVTLLNYLFSQSASTTLSHQLVKDTTPDPLGCAQY
jgi:hypothetical protein